MQQPRRPAGQTIDDEAHLEFVVGFPCTRFHCPGWLCEGSHDGHRAVVCGTCGHCFYYVVEN